MSSLPTSIQNAIEALSDLPGIGSRSAERLVFTLLKNESGLSKKIGENLTHLKSAVSECEICGNYCDSDQKKCEVCNKHNRNTRVLCVVEGPMDLLALEKTHEFKGLYHVLHGVISPLNRVGAEDLNIPNLLKRDLTGFDEIILALSGSTESEATSFYLYDQLEKIFSGKITRLARGIPSGGDLDYLDAGTLTRAITERREV